MAGWCIYGVYSIKNFELLSVGIVSNRWQQKKGYGWMNANKSWRRRAGLHKLDISNPNPAVKVLLGLSHYMYHPPGV